ncbi:MAG TPA: class I SAM-dependent methyltransferase [Bryobacteraceae bacterium]|nr:class I SAM-dependent methyltransferase [Bryobacteraceae bacterium]
MRSLNTSNYDTDKTIHMVRAYEEILSSLADQDVRLLELGIHHGGSLLMWRDYFERGQIAGLDALPVTVPDPTGRIHVYQGLQQDYRLLDRIRAEVAPDGFDVVIDDASHVAEFTRKSFWHLLRNHLKPGGWYFIEDWGTGYWKSWPDGKHYKGSNHLHGMVGFVKELIDECGAEDITFPERGITPRRTSEIEEIRVVPSIVVARKSRPAF